MLSIIGAFAEFERAFIREGWDEPAPEGKPIGKRGPDKKPRRRRSAVRGTKVNAGAESTRR